MIHELRQQNRRAVLLCRLDHEEAVAEGCTTPCS